MSFNLATQNNEFADNLRSFLKQEITAEYLRKQIESHSNDPKLWSGLVELGIFEICSLPESEMGLQNLAALIQEFGYYLVPEPASVQALLGSYLVTNCLTDQDRQACQAQSVDLEQLKSGKQLLATSMAPAVTKDNQQVFMPVNDALKYVLHVFNGTVCLSQNADFKYQAIKSVDLSQRYVAFEVSNNKGIKLRGITPTKLEQLKKLIVCNEIAGILKKVSSLTTDYVKTRKQFGVPVGSFQAVQHKLADMQVVTDSLESLALFAAWALEQSQDQAELSLNSAMLLALGRGLEVIETAIQAHGGIGFTWEYELHYYLRRVLLYKSLWSESITPDSIIQAVN